MTDERGTALVTSIFAILIGTLIGVALAFGAITTLTISVNERDTTEAFYIADAGLTHAGQLINKAKKSSYSTILSTGADPTPGTGDELSAPPEGGLWTTAESIPAGNNFGGGFSFGSGRYYVSVRNDTATGETPTTDKNGILIVTSTGVGRDGAAVTLESVVRSIAIQIPGLISNGDAKFASTVKVLGPYGKIQVNGTPQFTGGTKCAEDKFEFTSPPVALAGIWVGAACDVVPVAGTTLLFNQPPVVPPIIDLTRLKNEFKPFADFVFKNNGQIYPQTNGIERATSLSAAEKTALGLHEWTYNSTLAEWSHKIDTRLPDGNYYFLDTNVAISKGGDISNPPKVTILSEGGITLNNEIALQPKLLGYAMVTANDLSMSSKYSTSSNPGLVYAYGQITFSNTTTIVGGMIAANFYKSDGTFGPDANGPGGLNLVNGIHGAVQVSGNLTIITSDNGFVRGSTVLSWREVRN